VPAAGWEDGWARGATAQLSGLAAEPQAGLASILARAEARDGKAQLVDRTRREAGTRRARNVISSRISPSLKGVT